MTDNGKDGFEQCKKMQQIVTGMGSSTRILAASIRDANTLADLAVEGLDTYTFSPAVARELFDEPLTDTAADEFEAAAERGTREDEKEEQIETRPKVTATIRINGRIVGSSRGRTTPPPPPL